MCHISELLCHPNESKIHYLWFIFIYTCVVHLYSKEINKALEGIIHLFSVKNLNISDKSFFNTSYSPSLSLGTYFDHIPQSFIAALLRQCFWFTFASENVKFAPGYNTFVFWTASLEILAFQSWFGHPSNSLSRGIQAPDLLKIFCIQII